MGCSSLYEYFTTRCRHSEPASAGRRRLNRILPFPDDTLRGKTRVTKVVCGGRSRSRDVQTHLKDRSFQGLDFPDARRAIKAPTLASCCPALLSMVTWKHPRHWASVWSRGRAERARQRAAASRLRGAVHVPCTSTISARWVLRARRSRAEIHRIGARSGQAAHQHASSRPTPRPPAASPRSTPCTNPTPTTAAVVVVVDGRARARSRLYSAAHRVPSTTATRQAVTLRARAAGAPGVGHVQTDASVARDLGPTCRVCRASRAQMQEPSGWWWTSGQVRMLEHAEPPGGSTTTRRK